MLLREFFLCSRRESGQQSFDGNPADGFLRAGMQEAGPFPRDVIIATLLVNQGE